MRQLKEWIMRMSIRTKLVFYSYVIIIPILLFISILLFLRNYKAAIRSEEEQCIQNVQSISDSISVVQKNIMEMGTYICINDEITQILVSSGPDELNYDARLWLNRAPMQIIQDMVAIDGQIKTVAIYPENSVNPYLSCVDRSSYLSDIRQVREQEIYELAVREKGKFLWQRVGRHASDTYQFNQNDKIVMYREIYDLARKNKLGYLVIGSSADIFDEICSNALHDRKEAVMVISEYGAQLVCCGNIENEIISEMTGEMFGKLSEKELYKKCIWRNYNIYQCRNKETGTIVYMMVHRAGILDFINTVLYAPAVLFLGFSVGLYPVLVLISNIISKPLHRLSIAMENFKRGDFSQKVEVMTGDEVGEVSACFNSMVDDIKELVDKNYVMALRERESELNALQAQINPHFLYNTLDSLYWKAIESETPEIAEDVYSLSQLFRLILNRGDGIVTVRAEAELLERYLNIQKTRFGKRLQYEIEIDETIQNEKIPKLILQPFVENAIVHGFEKTDGKYILLIYGTMQGNNMVFRIQDTGVGMSREQLEAVWESKDTQKVASQRIGRYAIKNVKERLELIYRKNYILQIESEVDQGTTVMLSVPRGMEETRQNEY